MQSYDTYLAKDTDTSAAFSQVLLVEEEVSLKGDVVIESFDSLLSAYTEIPFDAVVDVKVL